MSRVPSLTDFRPQTRREEHVVASPPGVKPEGSGYFAAQKIVDTHFHQLINLYINKLKDSKDHNYI